MKIWLSVAITCMTLGWTQIAPAAVINVTLDETEFGSVNRLLPASLVTGILILKEPDGTVSDIVTFTNASRTAFLFSDLDENNEGQFAELSQDRLNMAIAPFPAEQRVTVDEADVVKNGYTPAAGATGYFMDANGDTPKWIINSDAEVPEPSPLSLLVAGIVLFGCARLWRRGEKHRGHRGALRSCTEKSPLPQNLEKFLELEDPFFDTGGGTNTALCCGALTRLFNLLRGEEGIIDL
jgi:hypothetical protein